MDSPQLEGESSRLLPQTPPHRSPIDANLAPDDPNGKLLWTIPLTTFFRPWVLGWGIVAAAVMGDDHSRNHEGTVYIVFTWLLVGWTILAIASSYFQLKSSLLKGSKLDFFFRTGDRGNGGEVDHSKKYHNWGLPIADLAWGITFMVFPGTIARSRDFHYGDRDFIFVSLFILASSQVIIAIVGVVPALRRLKFHLYKAESEDEDRYQIQLPRESNARKQASISISA
jgi:hypothetical protein